MLPNDYEERVYSGVLGKIIGVYLGRPFEGWPNARIEKELGDINYYVNEKIGVPLIVTDDDISGTFTFIRALEDYQYDRDISSKQIGQTWLNYLIDGRTVLWWGGLGNSTEHTAYIRLTNGVEAPESGSISRNGQVVAEQIGAQIFIDGWALVAPGDPALAADFAKRAGSVSHDGEAVFGAQVLAAMESQAFVESDIDTLIDVGVSQIPGDSVIARMISDIRQWHSENPTDWRATFKQIQANYGYDKYGGNCHIVPNHGLIIMALLHGDGDFQKSLMIVNTAGWDTDCNSGNLGCLMGIRNGLEGIDTGPDWRGPFRDTCYIPTADTGGGVTDAVSVAKRIAATGQRLAGLDKVEPNRKFDFRYPGSLQGFKSENCSISNELSPSGQRCLRLSVSTSEDAAAATTNTFVDSLDTARFFERRGYGLMTSPMLYSGQALSVNLSVDAVTTVQLCVDVYDEEDQLQRIFGPSSELNANGTHALEWKLPSTNGFPIGAVGISVSAAEGTSVFLESLDWQGTPSIEMGRRKGSMWSRAWINGVDTYHPFYPESFRLIQNSGTGLLLTGSRDWIDYRVSADIRPHLVEKVGIAARAQGMRRYYGLLMTNRNTVQLVRELDGTTVIAESEYTLEFGHVYRLELTVNGNSIRGSIDDQILVEASDDSLMNGGIALLIEGGRTSTQSVAVEPL